MKYIIFFFLILCSSIYGQSNIAKPDFTGCNYSLKSELIDCVQKEILYEITSLFNKKDSLYIKNNEGKKIQIKFKISEIGTISMFETTCDLPDLKQEIIDLFNNLPKVNYDNKKFTLNADEIINTTFRLINRNNNKSFEIYQKKDDSEEISFTVIEDVPTFPGCDSSETKEKLRCFNNKMVEHVQNNFRYPSKAARKNITGRVLVQFVINKEGVIENISTNGPHPLLENEARRIISLLPKMKPGKQRGKPIKVRYAMPITFKLE